MIEMALGFVLGAATVGMLFVAAAIFALTIAKSMDKEREDSDD